MDKLKTCSSPLPMNPQGAGVRVPAVLGGRRQKSAGSVRIRAARWASLNAGRIFVKSLSLESKKEWQEYSKNSKRPSNIPSHPDRTLYDEYDDGNDNNDDGDDDELGESDWNSTRVKEEQDDGIEGIMPSAPAAKENNGRGRKRRSTVKKTQYVDYSDNNITAENDIIRANKATWIDSVGGGGAAVA